MYKGIIIFKIGYQLTTNLVQDEKGDLLADSDSILNISLYVNIYIYYVC